MNNVLQRNIVLQIILFWFPNLLNPCEVLKGSGFSFKPEFKVFTQIHRYTDTQIYRYIDTPIHRYIDT